MEVGKYCEQGDFAWVTDDVEMLTGDKPISLEVFITSKMDYFTPDTLTAIAQQMTSAWQRDVD